MNFYKPELWPTFEDLFLNHYCPKFWSIDNVSLPYGNVMVIDPKDMPSMLWACDLNKVDNYEDILNKLKTIEKSTIFQLVFPFHHHGKAT